MAVLRKRKLKDGSSVWFIDFYKDGIRIRKSIGTVSRKIAEMIKQKIEGDLVMQRFELPTERDIINLKDFIEKYLEYSKINKAKNTYLRDRFALNYFHKLIGDRNISTISELDVENYKKCRFESISKSSVNTELRSLKSAFQVAIRWNYLKGNVFSKIKFFKVQKSNVPRYLTKEQINKLFNTIEDNDFRNLIVFYLYTGCRRDEALGLEWSDVDFRNKRITLRKTKSGKVRIVPISSSLFKILKNMKENKKREKVFNYKSVYVSMKLKEHLIKIGFNHRISVHCLRHTFASHLVMSGVDLYTVQKLLGHSDLSFTSIYSHLAPDYLRMSVEKLEF